MILYLILSCLNLEVLLFFLCFLFGGLYEFFLILILEDWFNIGGSNNFFFFNLFMLL